MLDTAEVLGTRESSETEKNLDFEIIQGGMGFGVSNYEMAGEVAKKGELGVVSLVGSGMLLARGLQDGGKRAEDSLEALRDFPDQELVERIVTRYYKPEGRGINSRTGLQNKYIVPPKLDLALKNGEKSVNRHAEELNLLGAFTEVKMAKSIAEGKGKVGLNLLEKLQETTLSALYGAMLADVDVVIMGAGIPKDVPKLINALSNHEDVSYSLDVTQDFYQREGESEEEFKKRKKFEKDFVDISKREGLFEMPFSPRDYIKEDPVISRPKFLAIVSSHSLAKILATRTDVPPDGFIVELPNAGGHNANPRNYKISYDVNGKVEEPVYDVDEREDGTFGRDKIDYDSLKSHGLPFWMAGGYGNPDGLQEAKALGAEGIQVGSLFALSKESGINDRTKRDLTKLALSGTGVEIRTDPLASPTGYVFKVVQKPGTLSDPKVYEERGRICDLGYLRKPFVTVDAESNLLLRYRCPSEPVEDFVRSGGTEEETKGRFCLCNGLAATIGMPQVKRRSPEDGGHYEEPEVITMGDSVNKNVVGINVFLGRIAGGVLDPHTVSDSIDYLRSAKTDLKTT